MLMTVEEARGNWCPYSFDEYQGGSYNRTHNNHRNEIDIPDACKCVGYDCMAWRWGKPEGDDELKGYCGLAGSCE